MSETEILQEFKKQLLSFFDELIGQFPQEGDLVLIRLFITNQIPIKDVMDIFVENVTKNDNELKTMITDRNELFFLEHSMFDNLGKDKVNHFKRIWRSDNLDEEDKEVIWNWVDAFVYLSNKYNEVK